VPLATATAGIETRSAHVEVSKNGVELPTSIILQMPLAMTDRTQSLSLTVPLQLCADHTLLQPTRIRWPSASCKPTSAADWQGPTSTGPISSVARLPSSRCHSTFMVNCMVGLFPSSSANHQVKVNVNPGPQLLSGLDLSTVRQMEQMTQSRHCLRATYFRAQPILMLADGLAYRTIHERPNKTAPTWGIP
jgi:hypothetical protein